MNVTLRFNICQTALIFVINFNFKSYFSTYIICCSITKKVSLIVKEMSSLFGVLMFQRITRKSLMPLPNNEKGGKKCSGKLGKKNKHT